MRRTLPAVFAVVLGTLVLATIRPPGLQARPGESSLPGARATIEAIRYPSLQEALDALPPEGGLVELPAGTFEIDKPLVIHQEDVLVRGAGTATHIKNVNEDGQPALIIQPANIAKDPRARIWRIQLADLRLTGNDKSGHGIVANGVNEIFIEGVSVSNHGGDGIRLDNCYEDPRLCNNLITYNKQAGVNLIGCHDIVVAANQFEENRDALLCSDSYNLCMTGNNIDDHLRNGIVIANTYGSVVSGNMIEECQGTAIVLERDCYGITLSANVIAHEVSGGIDLRDAHGCTVSANTFPIVKQNALVIGAESGQITVTGNNFSDSTIGPNKVKRLPDDLQASGLTLQGTSDIAVSGNVFSRVGPKGITVEGNTRHVVFGDNVLNEVESDHETLSDSVVTDNLDIPKDQ